MKKAKDKPVKKQIAPWSWLSPPHHLLSLNIGMKPIPLRLHGNRNEYGKDDLGHKSLTAGLKLPWSRENIHHQRRQEGRICLLRNRKCLCGSSVAEGMSHQIEQFCAVRHQAFPTVPASNTRVFTSLSVLCLEFYHMDPPRDSTQQGKKGNK